MSMLKDKKVLLGVTGGIAAYKACELVRLMVKQGADVRVIMTKSACEFVHPLTFETLSQHRVMLDVFEQYTEGEINHIQAGRDADVVVIAPATANLIAKIVHGMADDLLTASLLSTRKKIVVAPAMDWAMYKNEAVQENLEKLAKMDRYRIVPPEEGELASGEHGTGRLATLEKILDETIYASRGEWDMEGETVLVTAGPTYEDLDPVRYLGNRSSGKMGYAIAREAKARGANVVLISGPSNLAAPYGVETIKVRSNQEMYDAVGEHYSKADLIVKSAAVADYKPARYHTQKIEKSEGPKKLELGRTHDILAELGKKKKPSQFLVGFAAETQQVLQKGKNKLKLKKLDLIVVNDLSQDGAGFEEDTNIVHIIDRKGHTDTLPLMDKQDVAHVIFERIQEERASKSNKSKAASNKRRSSSRAPRSRRKPVEPKPTEE